MPFTRHLLLVSIAAGLTLAACSNDSAGIETAQSSSGATGVTSASAAASDEAMAEVAAWQSLPLTDTEGQTFTLADFAGQPVFIESFATWCPNCRQQLGDTNTAAGEVGEGAVFLALSTETDLSAQKLADYATENEFDNVRFAVMTPEFLASLADSFGNSAINPPSTPHLVVDAMGHPGELMTGFSSPDDITAAVAAAKA